MILDNTRVIRGFQSSQPMSYLRRAGLVAANSELNGLGVSDQDVTKANAELFYLTNLWRGVQGQAALPSSAGPTVNVNVPDDVQRLAKIGLGVGVILALAMLLHGGK